MGPRQTKPRAEASLVSVFEMHLNAREGESIEAQLNKGERERETLLEEYMPASDARSTTVYSDTRLSL